MKKSTSYDIDIVIETDRRQELADITERIETIVKESGIQEGLCNIFVPHATAAIIVNENADPNIEKDLFSALNRAFPQHAGYLHDKIDNNAQSHILAAILGPSETIPVKNGKLMLGTWQSIMLAELDGPRKRKVVISIVS